MNDTLPKRLELRFRRMVIRLFGHFIRRKNTLPRTINFNACKYLFIRQDRIGDVLISTPLFAALKSHYPNAMVDVLLSKNNYFVLDNDPLIRKRWTYTKSLGKIISLVRSLRNERYDFVVDLMDNPSVTSTILCLLIHAKWNIGISKDNSFAYDITVPLLSRGQTHIINRIAQLLAPFGIQPQTERLTVRYYPSSSSDEFADRFLHQNDMESVPIIGVNISAGSDARFWGLNNFKKLLNHIKETYPEYLSLILYQPSDDLRARMIVESQQRVMLSPMTSSFDQFAALVKRLAYIVTPDTAAVHLASAFKIGAVVLYVQSDKALHIWEPYGTDYECVVTDVNDLSTISVIDVQEALRRLMQRKYKAHE